MLIGNVQDIIGNTMPEPQEVVLRDIKTTVLNATQEDIDKSVFTRVRLEKSDFTDDTVDTAFVPPSLLLVNKKLYNYNLVKDIAPVVFVVTRNHSNNDMYITKCTKECRAKLCLLFMDNYLVLPGYINDSGRFALYNIKCVIDGYRSYKAGNLVTDKFIVINMFAYGVSYKSMHRDTLPLTYALRDMSRYLEKHCEKSEQDFDVVSAFDTVIDGYAY